MSDAATNSLSRRNLLLALAWTALVTLLWGTDLLVKFSEQEALGAGKDTLRLVVEQVTSAIAALLMVLFVVRWLKLFPLSRERWAAAVIGHTAGTVIFAFGHYALMVAMRLACYSVLGLSYVWREPFVGNLIVEYQKDIKIYLGFVVVIVGWQLFASRHGDKAMVGGRLRVQTGQGTAFVSPDEIDYLEASRNYIVVHANGREYLVRDTLASVLERLDSTRFLRTHRSYVVNVERIRELRQVDSKPVMLLSTGAEVPLSRSYRDDVTAALGG